MVTKTLKWVNQYVLIEDQKRLNVVVIHVHSAGRVASAGQRRPHRLRAPPVFRPAALLLRPGGAHVPNRHAFQGGTDFFPHLSVCLP
eukprot:4706612-Pyramimonas_sp.AAC.1